MSSDEYEEEIEEQDSSEGFPLLVESPKPRIRFEFGYFFSLVYWKLINYFD